MIAKHIKILTLKECLVAEAPQVIMVAAATFILIPNALFVGYVELSI